MGTDVLFLKQTNVINKKSSPIYNPFTVPPVTRGSLLVVTCEDYSLLPQKYNHPYS